MDLSAIFVLVAISSSVAAGLEDHVSSTLIDSLTVGELKRTFGLYVPHTVMDKPALVLAFHGSDGDATQPRIFGFERIADSEGFILAYPNGFEGHWNDCRRAGAYSANTQNVNDVEFMRRLVACLADRYGVDSMRVFATGWSNGGQFAYRLALESPDLIAAAAPFCANLPVDTNLDCAPSNHPISVMIVNGTKDQISPWEGGSSPHGEVLSAEATFAYWADVAGLHGEPSVTLFPDVVTDDESTVEQRTLSSDHIEVSLVVVRGGGHTLPGSSMKGGGRLGAVNRDVDGAEIIWRFFSRHLLK
jgi:polyhydroxybutyrate depolymerase